MPTSPTSAITDLLHAAQAGEEAAFGQLFGLIYDELHRLAHHVRRDRASDTLNTTALVHEAYFKLIHAQDIPWKDRAHFLAIAARAMRQVLVNYAQHKQAKKRGGGLPEVSLEDVDLLSKERCAEVLALDEALAQLQRLNARQGQIVECRFFGGLTVNETAEALDLSPRTVKRDWQSARAWLSREIKLLL